MEFVLLLFAMLGLLAHSAFLHTSLFLLHAIVATWIAWKLVRKQPLTAAFIVSYVAMYFPNSVAVLCGWMPQESDTSVSVLYTSNALIMIGLDLFMVAARRFRLNSFYADRLPRIRVEHVPVDTAIAIGLIISATGLVVLIVIVTGMGINVFLDAKSVRVGYGEHTRYYGIATYSFMLVPLVVFLIGLKRYSLQLPYLIPVACLLIVQFMIFRNRTPPVAALIAYIVARVASGYLVTVGARPLRGRLSATARITFIVGVPLIAMAGVSIKYLRASYAQQRYEVTQKRVERLLEHTFAGGDFGFSIFLRKAMTYFPDSHPYLRGQSYYRLLFVPIPRAIWPGKPENTNRIFARVVDPDLGRRNVTIPPGIVGDLYINFGPLGVVGMMVFGGLFGREPYRRFRDLVFLAGMGNWVFHLTRGALTNPIVTLVMTWILASILSRIVTRGALVQYPESADWSPADGIATAAPIGGSGFAARGHPSE